MVPGEPGEPSKQAKPVWQIHAVMRTHLPREPDELHSWDDIHLIDDDTHKRYAKTVAFAERIAARYVADDKNAPDLSLVTLRKVQLNKDPIQLNLRADVISAFYLPVNLHWFQLRIGGITVGEWTDSPRALADILKEARTVPTANPHHLEDLLALARSGGNIGHLPHNQITLDGVEYRRLEAVQPFLPLSRLYNKRCAIATSEPCTVYIEQVALAYSNIKMLTTNGGPDTYYIEGQRLGVAFINNGSCNLLGTPCKSFEHNTDMSSLSGLDVPPSALAMFL